MSFHKETPAEAGAGDTDTKLSPCPQMRTLLSRLADQTLSHGPLHWYATHHVAGCAHCETALRSLQALNKRLRHLGLADLTVSASHPEGKGRPDALALTADRWETVQAAWQAADTSTSSSDAM